MDVGVGEDETEIEIWCWLGLGLGLESNCPGTSFMEPSKIYILPVQMILFIFTLLNTKNSSEILKIKFTEVLLTEKYTSYDLSEFRQ